MTPTDEAISKLTAAAEVTVAKLGTLGQKYGGEVIDAGLWVVRIHAVADLLWGLALAGAALASFLTFRRLIPWAKSVVAKDPESDWAWIPVVLSLVVVFPFGVSSAMRLFDIWNWVAIFEPKLWVAKRLLGL